MPPLLHESQSPLHSLAHRAHPRKRTDRPWSQDVCFVHNDHIVRTYHNRDSLYTSCPENGHLGKALPPHSWYNTAPAPPVLWTHPDSSEGTGMQRTFSDSTHSYKNKRRPSQSRRYPDIPWKQTFPASTLPLPDNQFLSTYNPLPQNHESWYSGEAFPLPPETNNRVWSIHCNKETPSGNHFSHFRQKDSPYRSGTSPDAFRGPHHKRSPPALSSVPHNYSLLPPAAPKILPWQDGAAPRSDHWPE